MYDDTITFDRLEPNEQAANNGMNSCMDFMVFSFRAWLVGRIASIMQTPPTPL